MDPLTTAPIDPNDPNQTLVGILQQIAQLQRAPMMASNPLTQIGTALAGFGAGVQGRPNPVMEMARQQRQDELESLKTQASVAGSMATIANQKATQTRQARQDALALRKTETELGWKAVDSPHPEIRKSGYERLQRVGEIAPGADLDRLAAFNKADVDRLRDEALLLTAYGFDISGPAFQNRYSMVPPEVLGAVKKDPSTVGALLSKPKSTDDVLKMLEFRIRQTPPEAWTEQDKRTILAIDETRRAPVNYGPDFNRIAAQYGIDPKRVTPAQAAQINTIIETNKPPTLDRRINEQIKQQGLTGQAALDFHTKALATSQGANEAARTAARPLPNETQQDLQTFNNTLARLSELGTFGPKEIDAFTGVLNNPLKRAAVVAKAATGAKLSDEDQRFLQFDALMGYFQKGLFEEGGKQLTITEMRVARMSVPTGRETGGATEMLAKAKYLEAFTKVARDARVALATIGRGELARDPDLLDRTIAASMKREGLEIPDGRNKPWMKFLSKGEQAPATAGPPPGFREAK